MSKEKRMKREYFPIRTYLHALGILALSVAFTGCGGPEASRPDDYPPAPKSDEVAIEGDDGAPQAQETIEAPPQ